MRSNTTTCLAFDFGAGSGRALAVTTDGATLCAQEVSRFPSVEYSAGGARRCSADRLFTNVEEGLRAARASGYRIASVGADSWGVDFGYLDAAGALIEDPYSYRDHRSLRGHAACSLDDAWLAQETQAQVLSINTLFQIVADRLERPQIPARAARIVMIAGLVNHYLTGKARIDITAARTTGLHSWNAQGWSRAILERTGLPAALLGEVSAPGQVLGPLRPDVAARCGCSDISPDISVVMVAGHDTACAACALPMGPDDAFMIAGSWNLIGFETRTLPAGMLAEGFGAEGGYDGRCLVTKSLTGLVLMRRLREALGESLGQVPDFVEMARMARHGRTQGPLPAPLDTTDPELLEGNILDAIRRQCAPAPLNEAQAVLALYLGLTEHVATQMERIARLRSRPVSALRLGGGGTRDVFLCQMLADRLGIPVLAGPSEASAIGNALLQFIGLGIIADLDAAREIVAKSGDIIAYYPADAQ